MEAARLPSSPLDHEVFALVANFSPRRRTVEALLRTAGGTAERRRLVLEPGQRQPLTFIVPPTEWVELALDPGGRDALPIDDRARLVLDSRPLRVAAMTPVDPFVDAALRSNSRLEVTEIPVATARAGTLRADVVVTDRPTRLRGAALPALIVGASADGGADRGRPVPVEWQHGHPLLRGLDLADVRVPASAVLRGGGGEVLVHSAAGPVMRASAPSGVRTIEIAVDLRRTNLARTPAFPILVARAMDWLVEPDASPLAVRPGTPLRMALGRADVAEVTVRRPDGSERATRLRDGVLEFDATELTGLYAVEGPGVRSWFAVNLLDPEESRLDAPAGPRVASARNDGAVASARMRIEHVRPFLAVAVPLLSIEIWLLQRRMRSAR
jgi:hypothetical protein